MKKITKVIITAALICRHWRGTFLRRSECVCVLCRIGCHQGSLAAFGEMCFRDREFR